MEEINNLWSWLDRMQWWAGQLCQLWWNTKTEDYKGTICQLVVVSGSHLPGSKFPWRGCRVGPARLYFNYLTIQISDSIIEPRAAPCSEQVHWHQDMLDGPLSFLNSDLILYLLKMNTSSSLIFTEGFSEGWEYYFLRALAVFVFLLTFLPLRCLVFRRLTWSVTLNCL